MILARCPGCATTFRVTPEQLKVRNGMVRCGQCKTVFNGLDALIEAPPGRDLTSSNDMISSEPRRKSAELTADSRGSEWAHAPTRVADEARETPVEIADSAVAASPPDPIPPMDAGPAAASDAAGHDAHAAGLIAARETRDAPGYSKWAERPLAPRDSGFDAPPRSPRWPALLLALLLALGLLGQFSYRYRGEIAARWPDLRPTLLVACAALGCEVPLPHQADLISIEGSELQADAARGGLLVLQATLKNRAAFAQAYPALELSLTDTQDRLVVRRVLRPSDYLSAKADPGAAFPANTDLAVKLWIDARQAAAAGYRLYVFYP